jgi:hypothetical protein
MTTTDRAPGMDEPSHRVFRLTAMLFAALLGVQCVWLLLAELVRPSMAQLPTDAVTATAAVKQRDAASLAASIGVIRGDLWAQSAFTYANPLWNEKGARADPDLAEELLRARASLDHALKDGPHLSSAWLLLAGLALRFPSPGVDATGPLKMAYYTGPSEQHLVPLRLSIAVHSDRLDDIEISQFVSRDIRLLLARKQKSALAEVYNTVSPAAKRFIEQTIRNMDPSALDALQTKPPTQSLPD